LFAFAVTDAAVLARLVYVPGRRLTYLCKLRRIWIEKFSIKAFLSQGRDSVKEEGQSLMAINIIAAYKKYDKKDEQR
jgi:hypothetical protein